MLVIVAVLPPMTVVVAVAVSVRVIVAELQGTLTVTKLVVIEPGLVEVTVRVVS